MGLITQSAREYYEGSQLFTGDGSTTTFTLTFTPLPTAESVFRIFVAGLEVDDDLRLNDNGVFNACCPAASLALAQA